MYQLQASVTEYPTVWRVTFAFSATEAGGRVRPFGTREVWLERSDADTDPLAEALTVLARACKAELRPIR